MINYYALLMQILCSIWPVCVSENDKVNIRTLSGTLGYAICIASFCMCACCWNQTYTPVVWLKMLQRSQKQQKIVFKTSVLWYFTSKKAEICASSNVSHFFLGEIRKVSFFEVGSKLQIIFSITCLFLF